MLTTVAEHSFRSELLSDNPVVLDLGCFKGEFLAQFIQLFPAYRKYVAVEANASLVSPLRVAFLDSRICIIESVVRSESAPTGWFFLDLDNEVESSCVFHDGNGHRWRPVEGPCIAFRELVQELGNVDLVKMDIEGAEWEILKDWDSALTQRISQLSVEFHDFLDPVRRDDTLGCIARLKSFGYEVQHSGTHHAHGSDFYDVLFTRPLEAVTKCEPPAEQRDPQATDELRLRPRYRSLRLV